MSEAILAEDTREEYDAATGLNWSRLKRLLQSPAHYLYGLTALQKDSTAMTLGRAFHASILEPSRNTVTVYEGTRRGKEWEAFKVANAGKDILKPLEWAEVLAWKAAVAGCSPAMRLLSRGMPECSIYWERTGRRLKGRADFIAMEGDTPVALVDLKSTKNASPDSFARDAWTLHYHTQMAYYADGIEAATGIRVPCYFVAVEKTAPYPVVVYEVPQHMLDMGRAVYESLLQRLDECEEAAVFPGYADKVLQLTPPAWVGADSYAEEGE